MTDRMQATPRKRPGLGVLADVVGAVDDFAQAPFGYPNPPVALLSELLGVPAVRRTLERLTYGEPLTTGAGQTLRIRDDTDEAALSALGPLGKVAALTKGLPVGASIKAKGGNWLAGADGAEVAGSYKRASNPAVNDLANEGRMMSRRERETLRTNPINDAMNTWLDQKLAKYVNNDMATPEDPVRLLAERGVLHIDPDRLGNDQLRARGRLAAKHGKAQANAQSDAAKAWEHSTDGSIEVTKARRYQPGEISGLMDSDAQKAVKANPWLSKLDPDAQVNSMSRLGGDQLGFDHLTDELRNALDPASGLPRNLLLTPEQLSKVTVPQAVERVAKINEWRAAQKAEANATRANNAATVLHKEYPDKGFKWVELSGGDTLPEGWKRKANGDFIMPSGQVTSRHPGNSALADALKYEGETMGHCVGGYCDDVLSGESRIYSLRDAKGQPHVTIEASPYDDELMKIVQIKGKGNKAPNPEYLPFVQDFVRSGKWSDVGDFSNTGFMREFRPGDQLRIGAETLQIPDGSYFANRNEVADFVRNGFGDRVDPKALEDYARQLTGGTTANELDNMLRGDVPGFCCGGPVDLQSLSRKYAKGGAVSSQGDTPGRQELEALVAEVLGGSGEPQADPRANYLPQLQMLQRLMGGRQPRMGFADGGAVFGGGSGSSLGGFMRPDGVTWEYPDGTTFTNVGPQLNMATLGSQGVASNAPMQQTYTPSTVTYDTPVIQPTYAPQGNAPAFGGTQPSSANPNPPTTPPGPASNGLGLPSTTGGTRYTPMPTTVYTTPPDMRDQGSWFPINYNPAKVSDLVKHLRSQMYA